MPLNTPAQAVLRCRRIARQPDLVAAARRLHDTDLPALASAADLTQRLEALLDDARSIELRKKAQDPAIQAKLQPFTTPGYWQIDNRTLDRKPLSFTKLKSCGALDPTPKGAKELVRIVTDKDDKVRPRWKMPAFYFMNYPGPIEQVKEAQALLNELGPILVESKLLEP